MGVRYSEEDLSQIKSLVDVGLTNREIASRLRRSEAGIRNIRYRLKLKKKTEDDIKSLHLLKKEIESDIAKFNQTKTRLSKDVRSLEEEKTYFQNILNQNEEAMKKKIESKLTELKVEKPELFYMSDEEQIALFVVNLAKRLLS